MRPFHRALVRPPGERFAEGLTSGRLGAPDLAKCLTQHAAYVEALRSCDLDVTVLDPDPDFPDATFVEDVAVVAIHGAMLARPGAPSRQGEVGRIRPVLHSLFRSLAAIEPPGTVDGGDVCEADGHVFIGISERTNEAGAEQLARWLEAGGLDTTTLDVRGLPGLLHLKSGLAALGDGRLVATEALARQPALRGWEILRVRPEEAYAANLVRVNDRVLVAAGFPAIVSSIGDLGLEVVSLDVSEFRKMDGGLSCLSLRF
jgi:dimethylargininase